MGREHTSCFISPNSLEAKGYHPNPTLSEGELTLNSHQLSSKLRMALEALDKKSSRAKSFLRIFLLRSSSCISLYMFYFDTPHQSKMQPRTSCESTQSVELKKNIHPSIFGLKTTESNPLRCGPQAPRSKYPRRPFSRAPGPLAKSLGLPNFTGKNWGFEVLNPSKVCCLKKEVLYSVGEKSFEPHLRMTKTS